MTIRDYGKYLEDNSEKIPFSGCWLWKKSLYPFGHGIATRKDTRNSGLAHRESYKHFVGAIPDGLQINHICDVPSCINPTHLRLGTQKDNMQDVSAKKRWPNRKGSNSNFAKLTEADVIKIRAVSRYHGVCTDLGREYGVSKTTICDIRKGHIWK